jgi:hypothetical protein
MEELITIRDRIQGEYEDLVTYGDKYLETDGLHAALRIIDERIREICKENKI